MAQSRRARRTWRQRVLVALNLVVVFGCVVAAGSLEWASRTFDARGVVEFDAPGAARSLSAPVESGDPLNFLLVGTDSAEGLSEGDPVTLGRDEYLRADTIMIVRLDPRDGRASLLSVPRDLWVPIEGAGYRERINHALQLSESTLVATVEEVFEIPIHHYVQADFAGFEELVRVIDGVPIYFDTPVRDVKTGLIVEVAGCQVLSPEQSLAYARSRTFQRMVDDEWQNPDPTGDFGRQERQQDFIRRALSRAVTKGIKNPITLNSILNAALSGVDVDSGLETSTLVDLGLAFSSFDPDDLQTFRLPVDDSRVGGAAVVRLIESEAEPILGLFRSTGGEGIYQHSLIDVALIDGTGSSAHTRQVVQRLRSRDFEIATRDRAEATDVDEMTIEYAADAESMARYLARWFVDTPRMVEVGWVGEGDLRLITGREWSGMLDEIGPELTAADLVQDLVATTTSVPPTTDAPMWTVLVTSPDGTPSHFQEVENPVASSSIPWWVEATTTTVPPTTVPQPTIPTTTIPPVTSATTTTVLAAPGSTVLVGDVPQTPPGVQCG